MHPAAAANFTLKPDLSPRLNFALCWPKLRYGGEHRPRTLVKSERRSGGHDPALVTDAMIEALFVTGNLAERVEKMTQVASMAAQHGCR